MKYLKKYEDYTTMNYPDLYDEPVVDYVETDYYDTNIIEEDPEKIPNDTGRETKKKKRKSPMIYSAS